MLDFVYVTFFKCLCDIILLHFLYIGLMHVFVVHRKGQVIEVTSVVLTLVFQNNDIVFCHCFFFFLYFVFWIWLMLHFIKYTNMKLFVVLWWQKCEKAPKDTPIHKTAKSKPTNNILKEEMCFILKMCYSLEQKKVDK